MSFCAFVVHFPDSYFCAQARRFRDFPSASCLFLACLRLLLACFVGHVAARFLCTSAAFSGLSACFLPDYCLPSFASALLWFACFRPIFVHMRGVLCTYRLLLARFLLALCLLCLACPWPALGNFPAQARCFVHVWPALSGLLLARFVWPMLSGSGVLCPGRGHNIVIVDRTA